MKTFLQMSVVGTLLAAGGGGANVARQPSNLPVRYDNAQYGLRFFLPASWRGYTVSTKPFDVSLFSTNYQNLVGTERLWVITLRNPQWTPTGPYKDIPITVYTRQQGDEEQQERLASHAGGFVIELWHNRRWVFGLPNRYYIVENDDHGKALRGVLESGCAALATTFISLPFLHRFA